MVVSFKKWVLVGILSVGSLLHAEGAKTKPEGPVKKETKAKPGVKAMTTVIMETNFGNIEIELNGEKAPVSAANFLEYVKKGHYDGTIFHRVIDGFMIQGGGFTESMDQKETSKPIKNEAANGLKNERGTIAMARTMDPNSATAQFFINVVNNTMLDFRGPSASEIGYAVFGKVTSGMDVVDKIKSVPTGRVSGMSDVPTTAVVVKTVKVKQ